ncbi:MAG: hypothetical protein QOG63_1521, partial [Thermoleophilaceae bacterium]|nr:hypothetical protein [Thermoleophilaceae bacterium]
MDCGAALDAARPADPGAGAGLPDERRQVTVLFADLSGYTAVAERMDPEAVKALVGSCLRRLGEEAQRFGGAIDKYIGDNVMALFGAPVAHEDDAERAVRAGLAMQEAMVEVNGGLAAAHGVSFALRVGINTGEVAAGEMGAGYTVMGNAVNVASRLQSLAAPGTVVVGEPTFRRTADAIAYRPLDQVTLKGKSAPVGAWEAREVLGGRPAGRRAARSSSPLVGRGYELELIESLLDRVERERRPHLVTVIGEAGVGKSRLLAELRERLGARDGTLRVREGGCPAYGASSAYAAFAEVLRAEFGIRESDTADIAWRKLTGGIATVLTAGQVERDAATIGRLLGISPPLHVTGDEEDDPERVRDSFFGATRSLVEAMAQDAPLVLAFEDIHWADDGMLDLIEHIAQWVRAPLLVLCLTRDELLERRRGWGSGRRNVTTLGLEPLTSDEARRLVEALLPPDAALDASVALVAERSEGNPLFAEEMVRRLIEGGAADADLPDTVQGVLAARLDSLEPFERRLIQHAAVAGRTFWAGSLTTVAQEERRDLAAALRSLEEKGLVMPVADSGQLTGEREFAFKHVLIRDVAYSMLPKAVRARRHFEVARYVEERAGDRSHELVGLLAEHYARAASLGRETKLDDDRLAPMLAKALDALEQAGDAAASIYSNADAFEHYDAAWRLEAGSPAERARIREKAADVAARMGRVDMAIAAWEDCIGYQRGEENLTRLGDLHRKVGAALSQKGEVKEAVARYQRGISLLKDGPPCREVVRLYEEAAALYMQSGDNMLAIYSAEKALRLAERLGEARAASRAHEVFGRVFGRIGDFAKARENLEESVALARESSPPAPADTIRALISLGSHLDMSEADYDGAAAAYADALAVAERVGDVAAQVELHAALGMLAAYRADWDRIAGYARASLDAAAREGLVGKMAYPYTLEGLLRWRNGDFEGAEERYRRALALTRRTGWSDVAFAALHGLAQTMRDCGNLSAALTALDEALDVCERAGLLGQSIEATAARAVTLVLAGRPEQARESADEAARLAARLPYPVAEAAALEAGGASAA